MRTRRPATLELVTDTPPPGPVPPELVDQARALMSAGTVAELGTDVRRLAGAVSALDESYRQEADAMATRVASIESKRLRDVIVAGVAALTLLGAVLYGAWSIGELRRVGDDNRTNGDLIVDCTIPVEDLSPDQAERLTPAELAGDRCYERGQARSALLVSAIVRCGRIPLDQPAAVVDACIVDELTPPAPTTP